MPISTNPFSSKFVKPGAISFHFARNQSINDLIKKLSLYGYRGQIVGPHGCGKSTLIEELKQSIPKNCIHVTIHQQDAPKRRFREILDIIERAKTDDFLIIDGVEQLSDEQQTAILDKTENEEIGILVTCHESIGLPTIIELRLDLARFHDLVGQLVEGSPYRLTTDEIDYAFNKYQPNIREALFSLYDVYENKRRKIEDTDLREDEPTD